MSYKSEFPDYDGEYYLPEGWEDNSWHNDVCPHAEKRDEEIGVRIFLWQDYVDPNNREYDAGKRYIFEIRVDKAFDYIFSYATDNLEMVKELVKGVYFPVHYTKAETKNWKTYEVSYVDGHDMKFKVLHIKAANEEDARQAIFEGNAFEHRITSVKEMG